MNTEHEPYRVNLLRPKSGYMRGEVIVMLAALLAWGVVTFGFQLLLLLVDTPGEGSWLTRFTFFNLPFHFWFTAQMLPLWFIIICVLFNLRIDKLSERQSRRRDGFHD
jgi:putative solute:sodium symporter small subunit